MNDNPNPSQSKPISRRQAKKLARQLNKASQPGNASGNPGKKHRPKPNRNSESGPQKITKIGRDLRAMGGKIGSFFGAPHLGRAAGAGISRIFGQGDYTTNAVSGNTLMGGAPSFSPLTSGFRLQHREYIRDIKSSVNYKSELFRLNPGDSHTFPWLSTIATNFEEYRIHGMVVYLNTTSATAIASTNTALGIWGAVTQYDPSEPSFISKQEAENYVGCVSTVPSHSLMHGVECKRGANVLSKLYVRNMFDTIPIEDLKFYDWGNTEIFTTGSQAEATIGEMWITYDIEFFKPKVPSSTQGTPTAQFTGNSANTFCLGNALVLPDDTRSNIPGIEIRGQLGPILYFPPSMKLGTYSINVSWIFGSTQSPGTSQVPTLSGTGINFEPYYGGNSDILGYGPATGVASTRAFISFVVNRTEQVAQQITFNQSGFPGTYTLMISAIKTYSFDMTKDNYFHKLSVKEVSSLRKLLENPQFSTIFKKGVDDSLLFEPGIEPNPQEPTDDYEDQSMEVIPIKTPSTVRRPGGVKQLQH